MESSLQVHLNILFQMPTVNIIVLNKKNTEKETDPYQLMFTHPDDCGSFP